MWESLELYFSAVSQIRFTKIRMLLKIARPVLKYDFILWSLITVRKRSCGKVIFSQAYVKNSVHRGGCIPARTGTDNPPGRPPGQTPPGRHPPDRHPRADTHLGRHPLPSRRPPRRTVRILNNAFLFFEAIELFKHQKSVKFCNK